MQMILIFEGADYTGKTSISKKLSTTLKIPYFKNTTELQFFNNEDISKYRWLDQLYIYEFLKQTKYSVIFDRAYPSDIVYSSLYRKYDDDFFARLYNIDELFSQINAQIILCYKDNFSNYFDVIIEFENIERIQKAYFEFANQTKCKLLKLNTTNENIDDQIAAIIRWLRK